MSYNNFRIFCALVHRDLYMIKKRFRQLMIDSATQLILQIVYIGSLLPIMGVSLSMVAPLYLGTAMAQIIFLGMNFGILNLFDIREGHLIYYRLTLPIPKRWLFASYIVHFMILISLLMVPLILFGIILLGSKFVLVNPSWLGLVLVFLLSTIVIGALFIGLSFYYDFPWFMANLWPRRLTFLFSFGPIFFTWRSIKSFAPNLAYFMLLNPLTYVAEGMRSALLNATGYIPVYCCIGALIIFALLLIAFMTFGIKKRMDPV